LNKLNEKLVRAKAVAKEMGRTVWLAADRRSKGGLLSTALEELGCNM